MCNFKNEDIKFHFMKIVVLTGAGISAESGLKTFRDSNGLWEGHDVMQVASPEGFAQNPALVLEFYNQRRSQLLEVSPNAAHKAIAHLEKDHEVVVVTQNVDDLHERAGSADERLAPRVERLLQAREEFLVSDRTRAVRVEVLEHEPQLGLAQPELHLDHRLLLGFQFR